jgi:hypothetical protein
MRTLRAILVCGASAWQDTRLLRDSVRGITMDVVR